MWRNRLDGKRVLLVLDDAVGISQIEPLLPSGPGCLTLVTSRRRLIALDDATPLPLSVLDRRTGAELFAARSHRTVATEADRNAVARIAELCGFLPLAIVLLAGRLAHHPAWTTTDFADVLAATTDRLSELDTGDRAVRAAFTMSYNDLPAPHQFLFRRLGLHPGLTIDASSASALAGIPATEARKQLEGLYTDHLVDEVSLGCYRLHDLLRDYARTLVAADPASENHRAIDRLVDYYQYSALAANKYLSRQTLPRKKRDNPLTRDANIEARAFDDQLQARTWMRLERPNILACLEYTASEQLERTVELTAVLAGFLEGDGPLPEVQQLHQRAAGIAEQRGDPIGQANTLDNLGVMRWRVADFDGAAALHSQALTIYREIGNRQGEANAFCNLGAARRDAGDLGESAKLFQRALAIFRELGDRRGECSALGHLGDVSENSAYIYHAVEKLQQTQAILCAIGSRVIDADTLDALSTIRNANQAPEEYSEAADLTAQALAIYRELGDLAGEAEMLGDLANMRGRTGDYNGEADMQHALAVNRKIGSRMGEAYALCNLGGLLERTGDYEQAFDHLRQALTIYRELGSRPGEAQVLNRIGRLLIDTGEPQSAWRTFTDALDVARDATHFVRARVIEGAAYCLASLGDTDAAMVQVRKALDTYQSALTTGS